MPPNSNLRQAPPSSPFEFSGKDFDQIPSAPWWAASQERFDALMQMRQELHRRDMAMAKTAQSAAMATLLAAISVYSADAMGAMKIPMEPEFLALFAALLLAIVAAWLLDHRLVQQLRDVKLRSQLWTDLVDAVRHGCIDLAKLESGRYRETEPERLLRKEAAVAAQFLASEERLAPHLPIFGHCFTLQEP